VDASWLIVCVLRESNQSMHTRISILSQNANSFHLDIAATVEWTQSFEFKLNLSEKFRLPI
jgi:hypothetical protein